MYYIYIYKHMQICMQHCCKKERLGSDSFNTPADLICQLLLFTFLISTLLLLLAYNERDSCLLFMHHKHTHTICHTHTVTYSVTHTHNHIKSTCTICIRLFCIHTHKNIHMYLCIYCSYGPRASLFCWEHINFSSALSPLFMRIIFPALSHIQCLTV